MNALVAFGANLGDPTAAFQHVRQLLAETPGVSHVRASRLYRTKAVGGPPDQPPYLNGAFLLQTTLPPPELHFFLRELQRRFGRTQGAECAPRTLDLDLVLCEDAVVDNPTLTVPHPRMHFRWFVLRPLADLLPDARHPILGRSVRQLLDLAENPAAGFVFIGGKDNLPSQCERITRDNLPLAPTLHCPVSAGHVDFLGLGGCLLAAECQRDALGSLRESCAWAVALEGQPSAGRIRQAGTMIPGVDCRADSNQDSLARLRCLFDALKPGTLCF